MKSLVLLFLMALPFGSQPEGTLNRATELFGNGAYRKANDLLSTADDSPDASAEINFWLGRSFLKLREWDKAVQEFENAVQTEPSNARYRLWLGRAYGARAENSFIGFTDARRVIREFRKASELDPDNITIRFDLLEFYAQAPGIVGGGKDKAWAEAELISKLNTVRGYTARATIYEREEKWDLAEKELTQATRTRTWRNFSSAARIMNALQQAPEKLWNSIHFPTSPVLSWRCPESSSHRIVTKRGKRFWI